MAEELKLKKLQFPITLLYTTDSVISFAYAFVSKVMGNEQYYNGVESYKNRLFGQYHQVYSQKVKEHIVSQLGNPNCTIRLVFATVSLGMGLNAPHVRHVIHYKPPRSIEKYFQETGRAGRDGLPAKATLYYNRSDIKDKKTFQQRMIDYCKLEDRCLRNFMLEHFGFSATPTSTCCSYCK